MTRLLLLITACAVVAGCNSVVRPFVNIRPDFADLPADAMREVAHDVEQAVLEGNREPAIADRGGIVVSTPDLQQAIRTRAARAELLGEFRATGFAVENQRGLVEIKRSGDYKKATTRKDRDRNAALVMSENADRWALYEGLLKSSNLRPGALSAVQQIFYVERMILLPADQKPSEQ